ncbi:MAG: 3-phosphoshikimate 1-carboxyvinyltransferase [Elusimicrobiota bacterium]|jgi:3-phosphoshikimate 1-carboxyvinyltransferase|nr:3-phosphoshikimate 1-carboxyvinyltransferase [Elusimicrobiota bacterium]
MKITISKAKKVTGCIIPPADKSITHRAVMIASLADGKSIIKNYLPSADCISTINAFRQMQIDVKQEKDTLFIEGKGLTLQAPQGKIDAGNSGTTTRLLSGILSGQKFTSCIFGDSSLSKRPMARIIEPLTQMGAKIESQNSTLPMTISGKRPLKAIDFINEKSSAQVKSAVLFAGLFADGKTSVTETKTSRDHTERMLAAAGAPFEKNGGKITISPVQKLNPLKMSVPGDISSAAFFIVAALILDNSFLTLKNVGINQTRCGIIEALKKMGADIKFENLRDVSGEPVSDIIVKSSNLSGIDLDEKIIPSMIDEIPIFLIAAAGAKGTTKISGAKELRFKESDRIKVMAEGLEKIGAKVQVLEDGFIVDGNCNAKFSSAYINTYDDHRIAMSFAIAALNCQEEITLDNADCVAISYPNFFEDLKRVVSL